MKKLNKRLLSVSLCIIMIFTSIAVGGDGFKDWLDSFTITASAATSGSCGTNATWSYNNDYETLTISGSGAMNNYSFSNFPPWYEYRTEIRNIIISSGITTIGNKSFYKCSCCQSVSIPTTVQNINEYAFAQAAALTSINIPNGVTKIGEYAFLSCNSLRNITLPNTLTQMDDYAFESCKNLRSVSILPGITYIPRDCFSLCAVLESVTIPESVKNIRVFAFDQCYSLTDVYYSSTQENWNNIQIEKAWNVDPLDNATKHFALPEVVAAPTASLSSGDYSSSQNVTLSCATSGATIYYTTDGTTPTTDSTVYNGAISVTSSLTLMAIAVKSGYANSEVLTNYYIIHHQHTYPDWIIVKNATCTQDGFKYRTCSTCGNTETAVITATGQHTFGEWFVTENPTATKTGKMKRACSKCGYEEEMIIAKTITDYPTAVTLDKTSITLVMGENETLTATVTPDTATDKNVVWTTSDSSVATVSDGVVTAVAPGYASITVSTVDNRFAVCSKTCLVCVTAINLTSSSVDVNTDTNIISGIAPNLDSLSEYVSVVDGCTMEYSTTKIGTGTTVSVVKSNEVIETYTAMIFGDVNGDGLYDGTDSIIVNCIVNGMLTKEQVSYEVWEACDCNHDGVIDNLDVEILVQAGVLLANVDQTKSEEELQTNSVYQEYLSLIDQNPIEKETEEPSAEPEAPTTEKSTILELIKWIFETIFNYFKSVLTIVK